jgi:biotin transport system substrate-specific component
MTIATPKTLVDTLLPQKTVTRDVIVVLGFAAFIALMAQVSIPVPPYVPITGQTLGVFLAALTLGSRLGTLSVLAYLGYAAVGLPVLAEGKTLFPAIIGPTGGFIVGFALAAFVLGWLADRGWSRSLIFVLAGMLIASVVLYIPGLLWLSKFAGAKTFEYGLTPFIGWDALKAVLAALLLPAAWRITGKR